jgi:Zn-dependent protease
VEIGPIVLAFIGLLLALTVHEASHAWAASRLGDPTARLQGRLSLNPLVHIDPVGTVVLPLLAFTMNAPIIGWAKPVPVDGRHLKHFRRDFMWIALAGPASNLLLALLASLLLRALPLLPASVGSISIVEPLLQFAYGFFRVNILLAMFNMIPVPPLDGSNVVAALLPPRLAYQWDQIRPYGIFVLYGLMLTGILGMLITPPSALLQELLLPRAVLLRLVQLL